MKALGAGGVVVSPVWRDVSTPTLAATMDAMVKAVQAKIFPMGSEIVLHRLGVSEVTLGCPLLEGNLRDNCAECDA